MARTACAGRERAIFSPRRFSPGTPDSLNSIDAATGDYSETWQARLEWAETWVSTRGRLRHANDAFGRVALRPGPSRRADDIPDSDQSDQREEECDPQHHF